MSIQSSDTSGEMAMSNKINIVSASLIALTIGFTGIAAGATDSTPFAFKKSMHNIFHSYSHTWISIDIKRYGITDIHLKNILASTDELQDFMPEYNMDGTVFDRPRFLERLGVFREKIGTLKAALKTAHPDEIRRFPGEIFRMCVTCHEEAKLTYIFHLPPGWRALFQDYMHRTTENFDLLRLYVEEGEPWQDEARDHLKLIGYYLELLEPTFPDAGPSGIILDRASTTKRLRTLRELSSEMLDDLEKNRPIETMDFRATLNGFCVICHEPERIK